MNKDVIYIEPEDDITDIITKIENSKEKIVALVPPKKAGVFRSVVNIKLISKVGNTSEKTVVLVTTDPSIVKLAAATKIPVTKNLQTPPAVPEMDLEVEETSEEEVVDAPEDEEETVEEVAEEVEEPEPEKKEKKPKKKEKKAKKSSEKTGNPVIDWIKAHKKLTIFAGIAAVALIIFLVWAFAIAPAATVTVGIQTESKSFAENVSFTTNATDENAKEGKLYLQEKKVEKVQEVKFEATGKKNVGEKATGTLVITRNFFMGGSIEIHEGNIFTINGLNYLATENVSIGWSGWGSSPSEMKESVKNCANASTAIDNEFCTKIAKVKVVAAEGGSKYNIPASSGGWSSVVQVDIRSDDPMSGGTDNVVTIVEQSDIEKAKDQLKSSSEEEVKQKLYEDVGDNMMIIESSFKQETAAAEATPAAGEEVKEGTTPTLKATTTATVYAIDKAKMEEFITEKAKLDDDQKIYEIKDPFIENFGEVSGGYTGRLKTNYAVGPKVTDSDILEMIKGKGVGDAQHDLKNINGIVSVSIETSYPWVSVIPGDTNKITINIEVKEKEGGSE
ncbi:hypothetical protein IKF43_00845 [Candidatus Saccharibacteria bacterium]|nr:hypothetical protein [Candidatus Saccharibacteria bacterium]